MPDPTQPDPFRPSPYYVPPEYQTSQPKERSGWLRKVLALIIAGAIALVCMCIALAIGLFIIPSPGTGIFNEIVQTLQTPTTEIFSELEQEEWTSGTDSDIATADTTGALTVGQTAVLANLHITITDTRQVQEIEDMMDPLFGHQFWIVEATLVNTSADTSLSIEPYDTWMQDAQGNIYAYHWEAALSEEASRLRRPLQPGQSITGTFVYEIPTTVDALFWVYTDPVSREQAVFAIP